MVSFLLYLPVSKTKSGIPKSGNYYPILLILENHPLKGNRKIQYVIGKGIALSLSLS